MRTHSVLRNVRNSTCRRALLTVMPTNKIAWAFIHNGLRIHRHRRDIERFGAKHFDFRKTKEVLHSC